ncbi:MAG: alanyl-tRNA editing protein [Nanoarchaeota archaeon]
MTELLYLQDSYAQHCEATIIAVQHRQVVLNKTVFYPTGGGQPHDTGNIVCNNQTYAVLSVQKKDGTVFHELDQEGLRIGDQVHCMIYWKRRYLLMRYHSAAHVLAGVFSKELGTEITGGQLAVDKGRFDFALADFTKEKIEEIFQQANAVIAQDFPIHAYTLPKEEALQDPTLFKLANKEYIEKLQEVRVVDIVGFDKQADGGTHVRSLKEIGAVHLLKIENRGKNNKRIYFNLNE